MIITRTPYRISFFGGGSDFPQHYHEHGGAVLSATINKFCYITCRVLPPYFKHKHRIVYSKIENVVNVDDIDHPSVKACLKFLPPVTGLEITHNGDMPAMSGVGSSSSFTVGLLNALYGIRGEMITKRKLAYDAIHVEQDLIGENVGSQDQVAASFGGLNRIVFGGQSDILVNPVIMKRENYEYLQSCLMLFFTGVSRFSSVIAAEQKQNLPDKVKQLHEMVQMVDEGVRILTGPASGVDEFGKLLDEAWKLKQSLSSSINTTLIYEIYCKAMSAGALGGKVCGAGGGGFMLFFVPPEKQPLVKEALKGLLNVPFRFETLGTHVIFYTLD